MRVLVDTNILLRSAQPNHLLCPPAAHAVSKLLRGKDAVFFCSQNIAEFWNVATRPVEMNGPSASGRWNAAPKTSLMRAQRCGVMTGSLAGSSALGYRTCPSPKVRPGHFSL